MDLDPLVLFKPEVDGVPRHGDVPVDVGLLLAGDADRFGVVRLAGQLAGLVHQQGTVAFDHRATVADGPDPAAERLYVDHRCRGVEVEPPSGSFAERSGPCGEAHDASADDARPATDVRRATAEPGVGPCQLLGFQENDLHLR
jgi:hypothetical protein